MSTLSQIIKLVTWTPDLCDVHHIVMYKVIQLRAFEHRQVAEVMLNPTSLCLQHTDMIMILTCTNTQQHVPFLQLLFQLELLNSKQKCTYLWTGQKSKHWSTSKVSLNTQCTFTLDKYISINIVYSIFIIVNQHSV